MKRTVIANKRIRRTPLIEYAVSVLSEITKEQRIAFIILSIVIILADAILWYGFNKKIHWATPIIGLYIIFILIVTLAVREPGMEADYNFELFWSWKEVIYHHRIRLLWQILLNILLFVPLGILLELRRTSKVKSVITGFILSALIELSQLRFHLGLFEWDDMLHNTLGCIIGVWICAVVGKLISKAIHVIFRKS